MNRKITEKRIEIKFIAKEHQINNFIFLLNKNGFNNSYPIRKVNSIYYDNLSLDCLEQNLSGITPRKKYRLRWYGSTFEKIHKWQFEEKIKEDFTSYKKINFINFISKVNNLDISINGINNKFGLFESNLLLPQLICSYDRQYYEDQNKFRATIDSNINFISLKNILGKSLQSKSMSTHYKIIEIKIPIDAKMILKSLFKELPFPSSRISKYILGQTKLHHITYI